MRDESLFSCAICQVLGSHFPWVGGNIVLMTNSREPEVSEQKYRKGCESDSGENTVMGEH